VCLIGQLRSQQGVQKEGFVRGLRGNLKREGRKRREKLAITSSFKGGGGRKKNLNEKGGKNRGRLSSQRVGLRTRRVYPQRVT